MVKYQESWTNFLSQISDNGSIIVGESLTISSRMKKEMAKRGWLDGCVFGLKCLPEV